MLGMGSRGATLLETEFLDITSVSSKYTNRQVGLTYAEFEQGLMRSGYKPVLAGGGKVTVFESATKKFVLRQYSKSGPATVDVFEIVAGKAKQLAKYRLK